MDVNAVICLPLAHYRLFTYREFAEEHKNNPQYEKARERMVALIYTYDKVKQWINSGSSELDETHIDFLLDCIKCSLDKCLNTIPGHQFLIQQSVNEIIDFARGKIKNHKSVVVGSNWILFEPADCDEPASVTDWISNCFGIPCAIHELKKGEKHIAHH